MRKRAAMFHGALQQLPACHCNKKHMRSILEQVLRLQGVLQG